MRTNYVLIDFENVQPTSLSGLDAEHFRVLVFVGASQNKLSFETAAALQRLGAIWLVCARYFSLRVSLYIIVNP